MSEYDRYSPFYKTTGMLRNFIAYYEAAQKAVESGDVTWSKLRENTADEWYQLSQVRSDRGSPGTDHGGELMNVEW
jgi:V-type H+-transporting ATPase subunit A